MIATNADSEYPDSYKRVLPESELEARTLAKLIRSELPTRWQGDGVYTRTIDDEGRVGLIVSPPTAEGDPMEMELAKHEGTAYLLQTPSGTVKVGWTLSVGGDTQSNLLPHEPALIS
jgi:hypothetical protein